MDPELELIQHTITCVRSKVRQDQRGLRSAQRKGKPEGLIQVIADRVERGEKALVWLKELERAN